MFSTEPIKSPTATYLNKVNKLLIGILVILGLLNVCFIITMFFQDLVVLNVIFWAIGHLLLAIGDIIFGFIFTLNSLSRASKVTSKPGDPTPNSNKAQRLQPMQSSGTHPTRTPSDPEADSTMSSPSMLQSPHRATSGTVAHNEQGSLSSTPLPQPDSSSSSFSASSLSPSGSTHTLIQQQDPQHVIDHRRHRETID